MAACSHGRAALNVGDATPYSTPRPARRIIWRYFKVIYLPPPLEQIFIVAAWISSTHFAQKGHGEILMQTVVSPLPISGASHAISVHQKPADEDLIASIAAGDKGAMMLLFARHRIHVYRLIARITGNTSLAEDILSEVFLDLWRGKAQWRQSEVSTWLLTIARRKAISVLKSRTDADSGGELSLAIVDNTDDPETTAHHTTRAAAIRRCLTQLPPALQEIVDLTYYHGKSIAEVAQILGIPPATVKTRMLRARNQLGQLLQGAGIHCVEAN